MIILGLSLGINIFLLFSKVLNINLPNNHSQNFYMNNFFQATADFFESIFPLLKAMGRGANILFSLTIFFGAMIWIFGGPKYKEPTKK
jgi:hypothetical protein